MQAFDAKISSSLATLNEKINEFCPPRVQLGPNVKPIEFKIEIKDDGTACLYTEGLKTHSVPIDHLPLFIDSLIEALDIVEALNTQETSYERRLDRSTE